MITVEEKFDINYIDASSISKFNRCPACYLFERQLGLQPVESSMIAPDFGTAIHRALPYCYDGTIDKAMEEFRAEWAKLGYTPDKEDDKRNVERAEAMLQNFALQREGKICPYSILEFPISANTTSEISKNEIPFLIDIGGDLPAAGRIDVAVEWRSTKDLWALDYKTASEISGRYFKSFENAPQSILYTLAMSQIAGRRAKGMIIEAIRVSPKNAELQLNFVYVNDEQISSFLRLANNTAQSIMKCNEAKTWPKNFTGCSSYTMFGQPGSNCPYSSMCIAKEWEPVSRMFIKRAPFTPFEMVL